MADDSGGQGGDLVGQRDPLTPDEVMLLARAHIPKAVQRLAELLDCGGRQAGVAVMAAKALYEIAYPENDKLRRAVEKEIQRLLDEARRKRTLPAGDPR